jgi:putative ABC transport system permease protein
LHHRVFTAINVVGLAVGMVIFGIFSTSAGIKLNSDKFHKHAERIYTIVQVFEDEENKDIHAAYTSSPLKKSILSEIPEIEQATRIYDSPTMVIKSNDHIFYENRILFADPEFFEMFAFKLITGDPKTALSEPNSIILTKYNAEKFFGNINPLGKNLYINNKLMVVTGVIEDTPRTSSIRYNFLVSYASLPQFLPNLDSNHEYPVTTFLLLKENASAGEVNTKLSQLQSTLYDEDKNAPKEIYLFPLLNFRLKSEYISSWLASSSPRGIIILFVISALMLFVVSINFINLSVARYIKRLKEIGIRKIIGASRFQLILQFLGESILISFIALPLALVIFEIGYPLLLKFFIGQSMPELLNSAGTSIWNYPFIIKYFFYTSLIVGFISGLYPAFYQSGFKPIKILKTDIQKGRNRRKGNKVLIILQFFLAIVLITSATITKDQIKQVVAADYGFNRNNVAGILIEDISPSQKEIIRNELLSRPEISEVSASTQLPIVWVSPQIASVPVGQEPLKVSVESFGVDYNFIELMEMNLLAGRGFQKEMSDDNSFVINNITAEKLKLSDPIGKVIKVGDKEGTVIGIADDFVFGDIEFEMPASILHIENDNLNYLLVRYREGTDFNKLESEIKSMWDKIFPEKPMSMVTLNEFFTDTVGIIVKISNFFSIIGLLAIFFSCLGLLGLTSILVEMRLKEMSIRKVLGASRKSIFWTISKNFFLLITIANILGIVLIHFLWTKVMQTGLMFITHVNIFTYAGIFLLTFGIAFLAIGSQSYKVANTNPANILSYE